MNQSIETGMFPSKLKHAKIIPIYKGGDELECVNYRPISLLSNFYAFRSVLCLIWKTQCKEYNKVLIVSEQKLRDASPHVETANKL